MVLQELKAEGICKLLDNYETRVAYAQTCFGYHDENGLHIFDGTMKSTIASELRGENGYGTDGYSSLTGKTRPGVRWMKKIKSNTLCDALVLRN